MPGLQTLEPYDHAIEAARPAGAVHEVHLRKLEDQLVEYMEGPSTLWRLARRDASDEVRILQSTALLEVDERKDRGITVTKIRAGNITARESLVELSRVLTGLVDAGHTRMVIDLGAVERAATQLPTVLFVLYRRCLESGGLLRVCGLRPSLADLFALTTPGRLLAIEPDLRAALEAAWPDWAGPRPLPIESLMSWIRRDAAPTATATAGTYDGQISPPDGVPAMSAPEIVGTLQYVILLGVLVVTPLTPRLDGEPAVDPLRSGFTTLYGRPLPRRLVVDCQYLVQFSARALAILCVHALRLVRAGGGMRMCRVSPRLLPILERARLPRLMEVHYPTVDEAVITAWERHDAVT